MAEEGWVKCELQPDGSRTDRIHVKLATFDGEHGEPKDEHWSVFRENVEFDENDLALKPVWGITPVKLVRQGPGLLRCMVMGDHVDRKRVFIRFGTAEESDAWRIAVVARDRIQESVAAS